jgi:hypothetical protein
MASTPTNTAAAVPDAGSPASANLLIHLSTISAETLEPALSNLAAAFPSEPVLIAVPEMANLSSIQATENLRLLPYTPAAPSPTNWVLTAADYLNTYKLAQEQNASACLLLGADSQTMQPESIRNLALPAWPQGRPGQLRDSLSLDPRPIRHDPAFPACY